MSSSRRLLLALLVLVLPLQGFAAAWHLGCPAAQVIEASAAPPCHEAMHAGAEQALADDAAGADRSALPVDDDAGPTASHKCGACAACHAQAAIASPAVPAVAAELHVVYGGTLPAWPAGRPTEALERPPRSLLA